LKHVLAFRFSNYWSIVAHRRAEGRFAEDGPDQKLLREYHGQRIHLPTEPGQWPNPIHLAWHRRKRFCG
jgi:hypothetical protein